MTRTLTLLLALALALPAAAAAGPGDSNVAAPPPGQPQIFAQSEPDRGASKITVDASCERPAQDGDSDCKATLQLTVNGAVVDQRMVTMPIGGGDVVYDVDIQKQRDAALRKGGRMPGKVAETLRVLSADGSVELNQTSRVDSAFAGWNKRIAWKCIPGRIVAASGGPVTTKPGDGVGQLTMAGVVPAYFDFTTGDSPTTVTFHGLSYEVAPHSTARMDCVQFFSSRGPFLVPMLFISDGSATVSGRPRKQFSAAVSTAEATFRSLGHERVLFTVSQDATTHIAEMTAIKGRTLQATHIVGGGPDFPCTSGKTVKVGRRGLIK